MVVSCPSAFAAATSSSMLWADANAVVAISDAAVRESTFPVIVNILSLR
jgi:hypothetical protein